MQDLNSIHNKAQDALEKLGRNTHTLLCHGIHTPFCVTEYTHPFVSL